MMRDPVMRPNVVAGLDPATSINAMERVVARSGRAMTVMP